MPDYLVSRPFVLNRQAAQPLPAGRAIQALQSRIQLIEQSRPQPLKVLAYDASISHSQTIQDKNSVGT
jgi:hypothetical protein